MFLIIRIYGTGYGDDSYVLASKQVKVVKVTSPNGAIWYAAKNFRLQYKAPNYTMITGVRVSAPNEMKDMGVREIVLPIGHLPLQLPPEQSIKVIIKRKHRIVSTYRKED